MSFKIVRNDITQMNTQAVVNTANDHPTVGSGCDSAIYRAAGYDRLLAYRTDKIGFVPEGEVFITPGFDLNAEYIIHAVSPHYVDGESGEEQKLRSCYRKSLLLAKEKDIRSVAFPLISSGSFGYPKEEALRIAADEINSFLSDNDMDIFLVVFDPESTSLGRKIYPDLDAYIDRKYVEEKYDEEYGDACFGSAREGVVYASSAMMNAAPIENASIKATGRKLFGGMKLGAKAKASSAEEEACADFVEVHESRLDERMRHLSDTFSEYLLYMIADKGMENAEVYKRAIVDKKVFSKIKNNPDYHPQKLTALCLCVGAKLNLDESKDLLARAGYALSPCDKTDIIFSYFIENEIYDMIELDIQLEEHGLPCIIE